MLQFFLTLLHFVRAIRRGLADPEFRSLCILVGIVIGSGTLFYHFVEGMSWIDAFYFCVITLTTVGYGDFAPKTTMGKLFTVVYIFVGLGLLAAFISYVAQQARENVQENGVLPRLRGKRQPDKQ
jgi:amino acid permease